MARLVVQSDIDTYGANIIAEGQIPMQIGDVIFFLTDKNASGNIFNTTQWTTARNGATIWIEGGPTSYNAIQIGTGTTGSVTAPSDINNPNHLCFFNGRGEVVRGATGLASREFQIENFNNLVIDFETNTYPGLRDGWGSGRAGTFGLRIKNDYMVADGMALKIENFMNTMTSLEIRGCELTQGSFAKIRTLIAENHLTKFIVERNLITRSVGGEGFYLGQTTPATGDGFNSFKNFFVRDNILVFTAAEAMQLQQCADGTVVENNVIFIANHDYRSAFEPFQDTGVQLDLVQGNVIFRNNIIYGHGSAGLQVFAKNLSSQTNAVNWGTGIVKIRNNAFVGAKMGHSIRIHDSFQDVPTAPGIEVRDNDFIAPVRDYYDAVDTFNNYYFDVARDEVPVKVIGGRIPVDAHPFLNPGESNASVTDFNIVRENVALPLFVNTGFDNIDVHQITKWSECYEVGKNTGDADRNIAGNQKNVSALADGGSTSFTMTSSSINFANGDRVRVKLRDSSAPQSFYATVNTYSGTTLSLNNISNRVGTGALSALDKYWDIDKLLPYVVGEYVWIAANGEDVDMNLYKCILAHEPVVGAPLTRRPDQNATYWQLVWWDSAGKNMYDPLYNGTPFTNDFMQVAGDFRLVKGSVHHLLGRGLTCNEQRDDRTKMGWQWKQTEGGTVRDIPGAYDVTLTLSRYNYLKSGRYYRFWIEKMNGSGVLQSRAYSEWQLIA